VPLARAAPPGRPAAGRPARRRRGARRRPARPSCGRASASPGARGRARRVVLHLHRQPPRLGDLVGVARADHDDPGHRPQRGQVLDRLVGRPVLAHADRVVREDVDRRDLHDRGQAQRRAPVVGEDQEPRAEGRTFESASPLTARPSRARARRSAGCARRGLGGEVARALEREPRLRRRRRSAAPPMSQGTRGERVEHLAGRVAPARPLASARNRDVGVPAVGQLAALHAGGWSAELGCSAL
jgi:hypothetical protein